MKQTVQLLNLAIFAFIVCALTFPADAQEKQRDFSGDDIQIGDRYLHSYSLYIVNDTLYFNGVIDNIAVSEIRARADRIKTIVITSPGGRETASLDLAEIIQRKRIKLEIRDYCTSGCANAVLVAAVGRVKTNGAMIGLHQSAVSIRDYAISHGMSSNADIDERYRRYEALYKNAHVDLALLRDAGNNIGMLAVADERKELFKSKFYSKLKMWIPTDSELRKYGLSLRNSSNPGWSVKVHSLMGYPFNFADTDVVLHETE